MIHPAFCYSIYSTVHNSVYSALASRRSDCKPTPFLPINYRKISFIIDYYSLWFSRHFHQTRKSRINRVQRRIDIQYSYIPLRGGLEEPSAALGSAPATSGPRPSPTRRRCPPPRTPPTPRARGSRRAADALQTGRSGSVRRLSRVRSHGVLFALRKEQCDARGRVGA